MASYVESKPLLRSKTFWIVLLPLLAELIAYFATSGLLHDPQTILLLQTVQGAVLIVNRVLSTTQPVTMSRPKMVKVRAHVERDTTPQGGH